MNSSGRRPLFDSPAHRDPTIRAGIGAGLVAFVIALPAFLPRLPNILTVITFPLLVGSVVALIGAAIRYVSRAR